MLPVTPLPAAGEVFLDPRGSGRALRVSWHSEADVVVLSLWHGGTCSGTFRLAVEDVPDVIEVLRASTPSPTDPPTRRVRTPRSRRPGASARRQR